jgi:uncharacterized damage-inducible protein DinB
MIDALYRHMEWADATVWRAIAATPDAEKDQKLRDRLLHLHSVQQAYMSIWRGQEPVIPGASTFADAQAIREWAREFYGEVREYLRTLDESTLDEPFDIPWTKHLEQQFGRTFAAVTHRDTLLQIPMHSTYHRGQVNTRLRELGATPPLVDYIAWAWFGKPGAEWP